MAVTIEDVTIAPNPVPSGGGMVRVECRISADEPVEAVTAYPPEGPGISFCKENDSLFVATEPVPPNAPPGTYDVLVVARAASGTTARTHLSVTLQ